jgi:hypothetical protein
VIIPRTTMQLFVLANNAIVAWLGIRTPPRALGSISWEVGERFDAVAGRAPVVPIRDIGRS